MTITTAPLAEGYTKQEHLARARDVARHAFYAARTPTGAKAVDRAVVVVNELTTLPDIREIAERVLLTWVDTFIHAAERAGVEPNAEVKHITLDPCGHDSCRGIPASGQLATFLITSRWAAVTAARAGDTEASMAAHETWRATMAIPRDLGEVVLQVLTACSLGAQAYRQIADQHAATVAATTTTVEG